MNEKKLRLAAIQMACQYTNMLPTALLHAKLIVDFVQTGQTITDSEYLTAIEQLDSQPTTGNDNET